MSKINEIDGLELAKLIEVEKTIYDMYENASYDEDAEDLQAASESLKRVIVRDRSATSPTLEINMETPYACFDPDLEIVALAICSQAVADALNREAVEQSSGLTWLPIAMGEA